MYEIQQLATVYTLRSHIIKRNHNDLTYKEIIKTSSNFLKMKLTFRSCIRSYRCHDRGNNDYDYNYEYSNHN